MSCPPALELKYTDGRGTSTGKFILSSRDLTTTPNTCIYNSRSREVGFDYLGISGEFVGFPQSEAPPYLRLHIPNGKGGVILDDVSPCVKLNNNQVRCGSPRDGSSGYLISTTS